MEKVKFTASAILLLFLISFISANWDEFEETDSKDLVNKPLEEDTPKTEETSKNKIPDHPIENYGEPYEYTLEYKLAWIFGVLAILIVLYLIYSFIKRPKNKWEK